MGGSSKKTTQSTSVTGPTQDFINRGNSVLDQATPLASTYTPFTGERVADFNDLFKQAQGLVQTQASAGSGDLTSARGILGSVAGSIDPTRTTQDYMNPYLEGVLAPTLRRLDESGALARNTIGAQAASAGAFGDSSYGTALAKQLRDQTLAKTDATNQGYSQAFGAAQSQKNTDLATLLATGSQYQNLEQADLTRTGTLAGLLDNFSNQTRSIDQAKLDAGYQQYQDAQTQPLARLATLMGLIQAAPKQTTSAGTNVEQSSNTGLASILGSLTGALTNGGSQGFMGSAIGQGIGSLAGLLSDERAKEDIEPVGALLDGQTVYSYRYKMGGPKMLGLLAQEVEDHVPDAVVPHPSGLKAVDYGKATARSRGMLRELLAA